MAIIGGLQTAGSIIDTIGGIFGAGHPQDAERRQQADALYARALAGDVSAEHQLDCLSGSQKYAVEFGATQPPGCGFATESTRQYARSLLTQLAARRTVAGAAGDVASGATQVGLNADPGTYLSTVSGNIGGALGIGGLPSWVIWGGVAVLGYLILKGRR